MNSSQKIRVKFTINIQGFVKASSRSIWRINAAVEDKSPSSSNGILYLRYPGPLNFLTSVLLTSRLLLSWPLVSSDLLTFNLFALVLASWLMVPDLFWPPGLWSFEPASLQTFWCFRLWRSMPLSFPTWGFLIFLPRCSPCIKASCYSKFLSGKALAFRLVLQVFSTCPRLGKLVRGIIFYVVTEDGLGLIEVY